METPIVSDNIQLKDCKTVDFSIDEVGTLLFYQDHVYRAIESKYVQHVEELFSSGMMKELIKRKIFVNTWISDVKIEGYDLILEHQKIECWNYPYEWSFKMLHNAAQTVLEVNTVANTYGYEIFDNHAFNVVYDMNRALYVDLGSFIKRDKRNGKSWAGYSNFYKSFYIPLFLYKKGYSDVPSSIHLFNGFFNEYDLFRLRFPYAHLLGSRIAKLLYHATFNKRKLAAARYDRILEKYGTHKQLSKLLRFKKLFQNSYSLSKASRLLQSVSKSKINSYWQDYHNDKNIETNTRFLRIADIITKEMNDARVAVEIASNQGKFAHHLAQNTHLTKVISTDYDKNALDYNFEQHKSKDDYLTLVYDFVRPNRRDNTIPFVDRINGDLVIALAVTHHLILTQGVSISHIFKSLRSFTSKYVIVEFMPLGLYAGNIETVPEIPEYYNLQWFTENFTAYFDLILDEPLEINRHLFVGKLKNVN